jgi:hypothetical protein
MSLQGNFGPFIPPLAIEVPIWLALVMKKNNKCSIVCPDWLNVGMSSSIVGIDHVVSPLCV